MNSWWHLAVAFKLRGPWLRTGGHGAQRAAHSTPGLEGRSAGAGGVPQGGRTHVIFSRGRWAPRELSASPTLQGLVKGEPQRDALGSKEGGRRERACAAGVGSAGEPRAV